MSLSDQLKAYYKLDESSGNAVDSSGNGATLTNGGTTTFTAAKINNGADFGITNSTKYLRRAGYTVTDGPFTISCWVKLTTEISSGTYVFANISGNSTLLEIQYEYNGGTRRLRLSFGRNNLSYTYVNKNITLGTSNWYHIVATYDQSYLTLYVDGVQETPVAASGVGTAYWSPGGGYVSLGASTDANSYGLSSFASCLIDEVAIYQRALSESEVNTLYNGGFGNQYPFSNTFSLTCDGGEFTLASLTANIFSSNIVNESKSITSASAYNLLIGSGYKLLIGSLQHLLVSPYGGAITNVSKPTTTFTNSSKVAASITNINKS